MPQFQIRVNGVVIGRSALFEYSDQVPLNRVFFFGVVQNLIPGTAVIDVQFNSTCIIVSLNDSCLTFLDI